MIDKDPELLRAFAARPCEVCGSGFGVAAHHLWRKGMGGGSQLDVPQNIIALCLPCHDRAHWGRLPKRLLLMLVGRREGVSSAQIETTIWELRRRPK